MKVTATYINQLDAWVHANPMATTSTYSLAQDDTYTLIPNGTTFSTRGHPQGQTIPAYIVQHDQTGATLEWQGSSNQWYTFFLSESPNNGHTAWRYGNRSVFFTFANWSKEFREKWRKAQQKTIEQEEAEQPMYTNTILDCVTLTAVPCNSTPTNPYMSWDLGMLRELEEDYEADIDDGFANDSIYSTLTQIREAIAAKTSVKKSTAKKENNMYATANYAINNTAVTPTDQAQRDYLLSRLDDIAREQDSKLRTAFHLDPIKGPKTLKDMIALLSSGDYTLKHGFKDDQEVWGTHDLIDYIRWSKQPEDKVGYDAAVKAMKAEKQATKDLIVISEPKDGLKALNAFEAKKFA